MKQERHGALDAPVARLLVHLENQLTPLGGARNDAGATIKAEHIKLLALPAVPLGSLPDPPHLNLRKPLRQMTRLKEAEQTLISPGLRRGACLGGPLWI